MDSTSDDRTPDGLFAQFPRWLLLHPDLTAPMALAYLFLRERISTKVTTGFTINQSDLAARMGRDRTRVNPLITQLERTHYGHRHEERCPDDGNCVQAVVKVANMYKGRNASATYWLNTTKSQVTPLSQKHDSLSPGTLREAADVTPEPVDNPSPLSQKHDSRCSENATAAVAKTRQQNKITSTRSFRRDQNMGAQVRRDDPSGDVTLDPEVRLQLHRDLRDHAESYGVPGRMILKGRGWRVDRWDGWEPAARTPDVVHAVIELVFTKHTRRTWDGTGFCWADQLAALGVDGLREHWVELCSMLDAERREPDTGGNVVAAAP